jgi:hypothetical protein
MKIIKPVMIVFKYVSESNAPDLIKGLLGLMDPLFDLHTRTAPIRTNSKKNTPYQKELNPFMSWIQGLFINWSLDETNNELIK